MSILDFVWCVRKQRDEPVASLTVCYFAKCLPLNNLIEFFLLSVYSDWSLCFTPSVSLFITEFLKPYWFHMWKLPNWFSFVFVSTHTHTFSYCPARGKTICSNTGIFLSPIEWHVKGIVGIWQTCASMTMRKYCVGKIGISDMKNWGGGEFRENTGHQQPNPSTQCKILYDFINALSQLSKNVQ